jgi:hypothetical protein
MQKSLKDSILQYNLFKTISVTDIGNKTTSMQLYHLFDEGTLYEDDVLIEEIHREINKDRFYATINDNKDEIYTVQFFQFGRQIQPLSYFLKK